MSQNLFVGSLSYSTNDDGLKAHFEQIGEVSSAKVIFDRETGRSRGFAFVEMPDDEAAQKAIDELNGAEFDQKTISVNVARPREDRPRNGGGNRDRRGGGGYNSRRY